MRYRASAPSVREPVRRDNGSMPRRLEHHPSARADGLRMSQRAPTLLPSPPEVTLDSNSKSVRFATRTVHGLDDSGRDEAITLWIEWQPGGQWAVGRMVNAAARENPLIARGDDYLFMGVELQDALDAANDGLDADLDVSRSDGRNADVEPFAEEECKAKLERWFFDHR